jgi:hypothetical protein
MSRGWEGRDDDCAGLLVAGFAFDPKDRLRKSGETVHGANDWVVTGKVGNKVNCTTVRARAGTTVQVQQGTLSVQAQGSGVEVVKPVRGLQLELYCVGPKCRSDRGSRSDSQYRAFLDPREHEMRPRRLPAAHHMGRKCKRSIHGSSHHCSKL